MWSLAASGTHPARRAVRLSPARKAKTPHFCEVIGGADGTRTRSGEPDNEVRRGFYGASDAATPPTDVGKSSKSGVLTNRADDSIDAVEAALIADLERAKSAKDWSTVTQLAQALDGHRQAKSTVIDLATERARRGGQ
ncbi:MAG TPA: hypothetical protein VIV60_18855 [Polyangiaceae bacterium]